MKTLVRIMVEICQYQIDFTSFFPKSWRNTIITIVTKVHELGFFLASMVGTVLSSMATGLILFAVYTCFTDIVPLLVKREGFIKAQLYCIVGLFLLGNMFFNFFSTMWHGPGHPPPYLDDEKKALLINDPENRPGMSHRFCSDCNAIKPLRTHHCSVCKQCILKMDHHCPWVNTCVGWRNQKHFLLFLIYLWLGSGYILWCASDYSYSVLYGTGYQPSHFVLTIVLTFCVFIGDGAFMIWSLFLCITNQTTLEVYLSTCGRDRHKRKSFYNIGYRKNCEQVFGSGGIPIISWLLPSVSPPMGDGIIFPMNIDSQQSTKLTSIMTK